MPQFPKDRSGGPIILSSRKSATSVASTGSATAIRSAMNKGQVIESVQRNRGHEAAQRNHFENDTETLGHATVTHDLKVATEGASGQEDDAKELAAAIQEKAHVVNECESGKWPDNQLIARWSAL